MTTSRINEKSRTSALKVVKRALLVLNKYRGCKDFLRAMQTTRL